MIERYLLHELVEDNLGGIYAEDDYGGSYCVFCQKDQVHYLRDSKHEEDCWWLKVTALFVR